MKRLNVYLQYRVRPPPNCCDPRGGSSTLVAPGASRDGQLVATAWQWIDAPRPLPTAPCMARAGP
eukprot:14247736-Alexandrium_andersonii.AAC.1